MADYIETGGTVLSNLSFTWRELHIPRLHGTASSANNNDTSSCKGGVYHYQGSGHSSLPVCRNRSIIWRTLGRVIELIELSFDCNLVSNGLRLHLPTDGAVLGCNIMELASHVIILFVTCTSVHRLILPHPETITSNPRLLSAGKGLTPSIFLFVEEDHFKGTNIFPISGITDINCCTAMCTMEGVAYFVLGSSHCTPLTCIKLPVPGVTEVPCVFQLQQMNVIQKLWNFIPTGGYWGGVEVIPLALDTHLFGSELIILSVFTNMSLKLWSAQEQSCVMEHSLSQYFNTTNSKIDNVLLRKSVDSNNTELRLCVCIDGHKFGIFDLLLMDTHLVLQHKTTHDWSQESLLIDSCLTNDVLWIVSVKDEQTSVNYYNYNNHVEGQFNDAVMTPLASSNIVLPSHKDPREGYLDVMFTPGHMTSSAISKTLMLYGYSSTVESQLRSDVIHQVEQEIVLGAGGQVTQDQYIELSLKCWNKFYTCSVQYEQLIHQPIGCSYDTYTGRITLIKQATVSFLYPYTSCDNPLKKCFKLLHKQVSREVFESFIRELRYHGNPRVMAKEISSVILKEGVASNNELLLELQLLTNDIHEMINELMTFNELPWQQEEEGEEESCDVFNSKLSYQLISNSLKDFCYRKMTDIINLLIIVHLLEHEEGKFSSYVERLIKLLHNYHIIYWLGSTLTTPTSGNILIDARDVSVSQSARHVDGKTLLELFLNTCMTTCKPTSHEQPVYMYWSSLFPWLLNKLIYQLWPSGNSSLLYECLLSHGQYCHLLSLHRYCVKVTSGDDYSSQFMLGLGWIGHGDIDKGVECLSIASNGIYTEKYLNDFCEGDEGIYWIKLMRCLEHISSYEGIVKCGHIAVNNLTHCPSIICSNIFKYSLMLKDYRGAYVAMMSNEDDQKKRECLRHLVTVLSEANETLLLCDLNFTGLEEEVERVLDMRAVNNDSDYDVLYCYHMSRDNFWKGAHRQYEQGYKLMEERPCHESLIKQSHCYVTSISLLSLVSDKYQWIVKPSVEAKSKCVIVTLHQLKQEYQLIKCKLLLIDHQPSLSRTLSSNHVTVSQVCLLLNQYGHFDDSLVLYDMYQLDNSPLYQELAVKCVELSTNIFTDSSKVDWDWLEHNESYISLQSLGASLIDQAWNLLRHYLKKPSVHQKALYVVTDKLLSLNYPLPQWIIDMMKAKNINKLIHLYTTYNHTETAVQLSMDYIDAVLGQDKESFGLKSGLHAMMRPVWVPCNVIDQLMDCCPSELKEELSQKLTHYKYELSNVCQTCNFVNEM